MFLLLPLYTHVLQPDDYGKLELVYTIGLILAILYGLHIETGYNRFYFNAEDHKSKKILFSTGQFFNLVCAIFFGIMTVLYSDKIAAKILNFQDGSYLLKLIVIGTLFDVLTLIPYNNLRVRQKPKDFILSNLFHLAVTTASTVFFLVYARAGVAGVLYGRILGGIFTFFLLSYLTRNEHILSFSLIQLKSMLSFAIYLIPVGLSSMIFNLSNRFFLNEYQSLADVGLYSLGAKLASVIPFLITDPVKKAFSPFLFEKMNSPPECKRLLADFSRYFIVALSIVALIISLFSREAVILMSDKSYISSYNIVFVLSMSYLLLGLANIIVFGIHISLKTWNISIVWIISSVANIFANIYLIPLYGRMGAAIATLLSTFIIVISYFFVLQRVYPVKFEYLSFLKILLLMILFNYVGTLIVFPILLSIFLKILLIAIYFILLFFSGVLNTEELKKGKMILLKKLKIS